jgi:hypothetical protein
VRLARAARRLPALRLAYDAGQLGQEAALLVVQALGRGAVEPAVERSWVNGALGHTVKRLRDEARWAGGRTGHTRAGGGSPNLMFSSGSIRTIPPLPPSDAEWHASLRRDPGRAREKVIDFAARALASPVEGALLRLTLPESVARDLLAAIEARRQALVADGAAIGRGPLPAWAGLLALLLDFVATWDDPSGLPKRASDAIYRRDGWRCMAPGCTSRRNLEDHHVVYRSRGGEDDESNRVTLCRFHHQQGEHGGAMRVRGLAPLGLVWRLGSAGSRAWYRNETRYFGAAAG